MNYINNEDTIVAIATAVSNSGISIIRISGNDSISIADKVFRSPSNSFSLKNASSHTIHYGYIYDNDEKIDEVLLSIFISPRSYTKENIVEISCHGGAFVTNKILNTILKNGARAAQPGEFTKRAFTNGRIDLSEAEAVIDIINAKNDFALRNSLSQLSGSISTEIIRLREIIIHEVAFIESALDDPEHYSLDGYYDKLSNIVDSLICDIEKIINNSDNGKILKEGINTLIIGKPNAGKSSILNRLSGTEKAIVTKIPGTTRDSIEQQINISGITLNLIDTAGVRDTDDIVEKIGVDKAISYIDKADLIMFVIDSSIDIDENDKKIIDLIKDKNVITILNKSDLDIVTKASDLTFLKDKKYVSFSAQTGQGTNELYKLISDMFFNGDIAYNDEIYITNARQKESINHALSCVNLVKNGIDCLMPEDCLTVDLMDAYEYLGDVIGEKISDDLADRIFSEFCMGK